MSIAAISVQTLKMKPSEITEEFLKHCVINTIRKYNVLFRDKYGRMVVCVDSKNSWRRKIYKYYKAKRKVARDASTMDWDMVYSAMDTIIADIEKYFPFDVISIDSCEADDIIAILGMSTTEPCMIVSGDHDFQQLLVYGNIHLYVPKLKAELKFTPQEAYEAKRSISITGCTGDGVPNMLSDDDTFIDPAKRQKPMMKTRLADFISVTEQEMMDTKFDETMRRNYLRNRSVVDFDYVPLNLREQINNTYYMKVLPASANVSGNSLLNYFRNNQMKFMASCLSDFIATAPRISNFF